MTWLVIGIFTTLLLFFGGENHVQILYHLIMCLYPIFFHFMREKHHYLFMYLATLLSKADQLYKVIVIVFQFSPVIYHIWRPLVVAPHFHDEFLMFIPLMLKSSSSVWRRTAEDEQRHKCAERQIRCLCFVPSWFSALLSASRVKLTPKREPPAGEESASSPQMNWMSVESS